MGLVVKYRSIKLIQGPRFTIERGGQPTGVLGKMNKFESIFSGGSLKVGVAAYTQGGAPPFLNVVLWAD